MRAEDILVCAKYLADNFSDAQRGKINIISIGEPGPAALHAFVLESSLFKSLTLWQSLKSWQDVITTPVTKNVLNNVVHGALQYYDLPDLISLIDSEKVIIQNPVNAQGEVFSNN